MAIQEVGCTWIVYCLVCADGSYYVGATNDINQRIRRHQTGKGAKYTRSRLPVKLVTTSPPLSKSAALSLEYKIKQLPRDQKPYAVWRGGINDGDVKMDGMAC